MSLKWYKNAVLDETQEAYGKTWRVDRIETDGTIVFRCGKETALAPRTDKEYFSGIVIKSVEIPLNTSPAVTCDLTLNPCLQIGLKAEDFQVTGEVVSYFEGLPFGAKLYAHDEITWDRALTDEEARKAYTWISQNWSKNFTLDCTMANQRTGQEGRTVAKKVKGEV